MDAGSSRRYRVGGQARRGRETAYPHDGQRLLLLRCRGERRLAPVATPADPGVLDRRELPPGRRLARRSRTRADGRHGARAQRRARRARARAHQHGGFRQADVRRCRVDRNARLGHGVRAARIPDRVDPGRGPRRRDAAGRAGRGDHRSREIHRASARSAERRRDAAAGGRIVRRARGEPGVPRRHLRRDAPGDDEVLDRRAPHHDDVGGALPARGSRGPHRRGHAPLACAARSVPSLAVPACIPAPHADPEHVEIN